MSYSISEAFNALSNMQKKHKKIIDSELLPQTEQLTENSSASVSIYNSLMKAANAIETAIEIYDANVAHGNGNDLIESDRELLDKYFDDILEMARYTKVD